MPARVGSLLNAHVLLAGGFLSRDTISTAGAMTERDLGNLIVVTDSSKWGNSNFPKVASLADIDVLVTDPGLPDEGRKAIRRFDIEILDAS